LPAVVFVTADRATVGRVDQYLDLEPMAEVLKPAILKLRSGSALAASEPCR
jgi:hypothetical protein